MCIKGTSFIKFCKPLNKGHCKIIGRKKINTELFIMLFKKSKLKPGLAKRPSFKQHFRTLVSKGLNFFNFPSLGPPRPHSAAFVPIKYNRKKANFIH